MMPSAAAVEHSDVFTKTLFVQLATNAQVQGLHHALRELTGPAEEYELNPHLSLIYAQLPAAIRANEAQRVILAFPEIRFNRIRAVHCPTPIRTRDDVEAWRTIAEAKLAG